MSDMGRFDLAAALRPMLDKMDEQFIAATLASPECLKPREKKAICDCAFSDAPQHNYGASFEKRDDGWHCAGCDGRIEIASMPWDFREDISLMSTDPAAWMAKYRLPSR